ncbi:MAG: tetratricopeptide repeat protein [Candidatus Hydrogenedentota bacterium]|uniref:TPR domain protein n=1 Tax=Sumerlaea chitinivorans TaxID=2250252 RepID=A0A2Z4Y4L6_SUMC1|nr:TPR domain protein [Candidatus Sumerlaea chitinivorans]RMH25826.1 MAG: tetratricopeptide repeat protein [Candidatus Hydrogenedentota bacterium]
MDQHATTSFIEQVNEQLDPTALLQLIGYATDKVQVVGSSVKAFCPIHKDTRFRSLLVDSNKRSFKCTIKTCQGFNGGSLVQLYALTRGLELLPAALELVGALDLPIDTAQFSELALSYLDEAERAFVDHDHETAETTARLALQFQPDLVEARLLLANIHAAKGETAQACEEFIAVAESYLQKQAYEDADRVLERAAIDFPQNEDLIFLQIRSAELQGQTERMVALLENIAQRREAEGRIAENIGLYEKLLELRPNYPAYLQKLADAHVARHDIKTACQWLETLARHYIAEEQPTEAIQVLERVLDYEPQMTPLRVLLVDQLVKVGEYERAKAEVATILNAQMDNSDFVGALQTARKWLEIEPESIEAHEWLARVHQEQANNEEAVKELRLAAGLAQAQGDLARTKSLLGRARFLSPEDPSIRRDVIELLKSAGEVQEACFELTNLAELYFTAGDSESGEKALLEILEINPLPGARLEVAAHLANRGCTATAARLYLEAAKSAEQDDDVAGAVGCYQSYLELVPDALDIKVRFCELLWEAELRSLASKVTVETVAALPEEQKASVGGKLLEAASQRPPNDPELVRELLRQAIAIGQRQAAVKFYLLVAPAWLETNTDELLLLTEQLLQIAPEEESVLRNYAMLLQKLGKANEAATTYSQLATLCEGRNDLRAALTYLSAALECDPGNASLVKRRADVLATLDDPELARLAALDYIHILEEKGATSELLSEYETYLERWPTDQASREKYAELLASAGQKDRACSQLELLLAEVEAAGDRVRVRQLREKILELRPDDLRAKFHLAQDCLAIGESEHASTLLLEVAQCALEQNDPHLAREAAQIALPLTPSREVVLNLLAAASEALGETAEYEQVVAELAELGQPARAIEFYRKQVLTLLEQNKGKEAEAYVAKWLGLAPQDLDALEAAAKAAAAQKRTKRAIEAFNAYVQACLQAGDSQRGLVGLQQALELEPQNTDLRHQLCQLLLDLGRVDDAVAEMQQLVETYVDRRDYKNASALLSRILEYRTQCPDTLERLASLTYEYEGFAKALPYYRKLIELRRANGDTAKLKALYESLIRLEGSEVDLRAEYAEFLEACGELAAAKQQYILLAHTYRDELNDPVKAIEYFGRATSLLPTSSDAQIFEALAELHHTLNVPQFAAEALREAVRLYEQEGRTNQALTAQERLSQLPAANYQDFMKLGQMRSEAGQNDGAVVAYRRALAMAHETSSVPRADRIALCEQLLKLVKNDLSVAEELLELLPPDQVPARALSLLDAFPRESTACAQLLQCAKRVAPRNLAIRQRLVDYWRQTGQTQLLVDELLELAELASETGERNVCQQALSELRELPRTPTIALRAAKLYANANDTQQAIDAYLEVAKEFAEAQDFSSAARALEAAMGLDPATVPAANVATLIRQSSCHPDVRAVTERAVESALRSRSRTRALILCTALLECLPREEADNLLEQIHVKAGAAFLTAIGGAHIDWLIERGRTDEARRVMDRIISLAGNSPETWWLAAQTFKKIGEKDRAANASLQAARLFSQAGAVTEEETCYREVLEEFPDDIGVLETLVSFYERERRKADVFDLLKRLVELTLKVGDHAAAARWLRKILEHDPGNLESREKLAEQLMASGDVDQAVEALYELARMYRNLRFADRAIATYERILVISPDRVEIIRELVDLAREGNDRERLVRYSMTLADALASEGNLEEACRILKSLVDQHPEKLKALQRLLQLAEAARDQKLQEYALRTLGYHHTKQLEYAHAIECFEKLLKLRPEDPDVLRILVDCCAAAKQSEKAAYYATQLFELTTRGGDPAEVRQAALTVLTINDNLPQVRKRLGEAYLALGDVANAVKAWTRAAEQFAAAKRYDDALACLEIAADAVPNDTEILKRLGDLLAFFGDEEGASRARVRLAEALVATGKAEEACLILGRILEHSPDDPATHEKVLAIYRQCGRTEEILPELVWLTAYYLRKRNYDKAEEYAREGLELDPQDLSLQQYLVEIARRQGRREEFLYRARQLAAKYREIGDLRNAATLYSEVVGEEPQLTDVREELMQLYRELGQTELAQNELIEIVRQRLAEGEFETAREIAETQVANYPKDIQLRERLADLFFEHQIHEFAARYYMSCADLAAQEASPEDRIRLLQKAVEARPRWVEAHQKLVEACRNANRIIDALNALENLTKLFLDSKRVREAVDVLRQRIQLAPKEVEPRKQLIELLEILGEREQRTVQLQELADLYLSLGQVEEAVEVYRQLVELRPEDPATLQRYIELFGQVGNELEILDDYIRLADLYVKKAQFVEATRTFERILAIDRRQRDVREKFIAFLLNTGQRQRAVAEMVKLSELYALAGDFAAAARTLARAHSLNPTDVNITESLAENYARAGMHSAAVEHYSQVVRACEETDITRAVSACRRILEIDPDHLATRLVFSPLLMRLGERAEAAANALYLAELYRANGQTDKASEYEARAKEYEPETVESLRARLGQKGLAPKDRYDALVRLGDLLYQQGEIDGALQSYRQARDIDDTNPELIRKYVQALMQIAPEHEALADLIALARCYENKGAALRALEAYEQVLRIDSRNQVAKAGRARMRKITNAE